MNLKETYNRIAEDWYKDHQDDDWWIDGTGKFLSLLKAGDRVLDVGCGAGIKSKYLVEKGMEVTGIDFSEKFIELAKKEAPKASFQVLDMREVESLGQQFEGVFAQASLLHIPKKEIREVLEGLVSVLKAEGYLYVAVKGRRMEEVEEGVRVEKDYGYEYSRFFSYYLMEELEEYFKSFNLDIVYRNVKRVGQTEWLQIIGRKV